MTNPVIEAIRGRRSIRFYEDKPVPAELVELLVELGQLAPTGKGVQAWHFTVLRDRALMTEISEANKALMLASGDAAEIEKAQEPGFDTFRGAPMAIILSGEVGQPYAEADCANAMTTMAIAAESMGLSSCYIASFRRALAKPEYADLLARLEIPAGYEPKYALSIGYCAKAPNPRKPRKEGAVNYVG